MSKVTTSDEFIVVRQLIRETLSDMLLGENFSSTGGFSSSSAMPGEDSPFSAAGGGFASSGAGESAFSSGGEFSGGGGEYAGYFSDIGATSDQPMARRRRKSQTVSANISGDVKRRVLKISAETGVKAEAVYGIEMTESSGNPSALAFNDKVFTDYLESEEEKKLAEEAGIKAYRVNRYGDDASEKFEQAYAINKSAAIKGAAWGWYQVLGVTSLPLHGNDPEKFRDAFDSDPMKHSVDAFIQWVKNRGSGFVNAINNDKHRKWVKMYYGPKAFDNPGDGDEYVERYKRAMAAWSGTDAT